MDTTGQIEKFLRDIRNRNRREIIVGIVMLPMFGLFAASAQVGSLTFIGHLLILPAILLVIGMMWLVASARGDLSSHPAGNIQHWEAEMLRQAKLLRLVPLWYLGPFIPGLTLLSWPKSLPLDTPSAVSLAFIVAMFVVIAWLNRKAAAELAQQAISLREEQADQGISPTS